MSDLKTALLSLVDDEKAFVATCKKAMRIENGGMSHCLVQNGDRRCGGPNQTPVMVLVHSFVHLLGSVDVSPTEVFQEEEEEPGAGSRSVEPSLRPRRHLQHALFESRRPLRCASKAPSEERVAERLKILFVSSIDVRLVTVSKTSHARSAI